VPSGHAIVIGCSFAGLGAARLLSERFQSVTIVERDTLPETWSPRKGVPQSPHVHGIPKLGREMLDEMLPGFVDRTRDCGAVLFDQIRFGASWNRYGWSARGDSAAVGFGVRRALLEHVAREMVFELPRVAVVHGRVEGLSALGGRVTGVRVRHDDDRVAEIDADLVVDAGGKGSSGPSWLQEAGFRAPPETMVNGFVGYASRWLHVPDEAWPGDYRYISQMPTPVCPYGGILYPQDNGIYVMSLFGHAGNYPPSGEQEYLAFLERCVTPLMHYVVSRSEPVSPISTSRSTANRRRQYELVDDLPAGFVVIGDALAAFNPIFGQGISSGLMAAATLAATVAELEDDPAAVPSTFYRRFSTWLDTPWHQAIGFDLAFPTTVGPRPEITPERAEALAHLDVLLQVATVDHDVAAAVLIANQSFDPTLLRTPELEAAAKLWVDSGRTPAVSDPARPPAIAR
jgi:2-polyprenyl-6-methoxyphenol hydroxylase-like FAD-dependent oxidoreductase